MDASTGELVRRRAENRCEYCHMPQEADSYFTFHVDHIVAQQHQGGNNLENLALACNRCNGYKGPNLSSVDPETSQVVPLFHPRLNTWREHFVCRGEKFAG